MPVTTKQRARDDPNPANMKRRHIDKQLLEVAKVLNVREEDDVALTTLCFHLGGYLNQNAFGDVTHVLFRDLNPPKREECFRAIEDHVAICNDLVSVFARELGESTSKPSAPPQPIMWVEERHKQPRIPDNNDDNHDSSDDADTDEDPEPTPATHKLPPATKTPKKAPAKKAAPKKGVAKEIAKKPAPPPRSQQNDVVLNVPVPVASVPASVLKPAAPVLKTTAPPAVLKPAAPATVPERVEGNIRFKPSIPNVIPSMPPDALKTTAARPELKSTARAAALETAAPPPIIETTAPPPVLRSTGPPPIIKTTAPRPPASGASKDDAIEIDENEIPSPPTKNWPVDKKQQWTEKLKKWITSLENGKVHRYAPDSSKTTKENTTPQESFGDFMRRLNNAKTLDELDKLYQDTTSSYKKGKQTLASIRLVKKRNIGRRAEEMIQAGLIEKFGRRKPNEVKKSDVYHALQFYLLCKEYPSLPWLRGYLMGFHMYIPRKTLRDMLNNSTARDVFKVVVD